MNLAGRRSAAYRFIFKFWLRVRKLLPKQKADSFGSLATRNCPGIEKIYVINLDRERGRWSGMINELRHVLDSSGADIFGLTERYSAVDATAGEDQIPQSEDVDPTYSLRDQLFVEPQPSTLPTQYKLDASIQMSKAEIAVAQSHINIWRKVAESESSYALILEDDVWFHSDFGECLDNAWKEILADSNEAEAFDVLYISYAEVKNGAPKHHITRNTFRPERGLWHLSGYILSRKGAKKLLQLLPCRGPVDLWINHQFKQLDVIATKRPLASQRSDAGSSNSYSILPSLTAIGAINSEGPASFSAQPIAQPVFAFGPEGSGLSSVAMALSMLGYRCCSDLQTLPEGELTRLLEGNRERIFDAYVNIGSLGSVAGKLRDRYPTAKFIITTTENSHDVISQSDVCAAIVGADIVFIQTTTTNPWQVICEHLRVVPPSCAYPIVREIGQRSVIDHVTEMVNFPEAKRLRSDKSPWVVRLHQSWQGIRSVPTKYESSNTGNRVRISDPLQRINQKFWALRSDTFTDNLALFRPENIHLNPHGGIALSVKKETLGVRHYSAAALCSQDEYQFGRFEAVVKASNAPGIVTGIFLHRNSPRQEIDIEIAGNRPDRLLVNVFYNPGGAGANFDYGFRGAPCIIELGFDASEAEHRYAVEWNPCEILWFVDGRLVHRRTMWEPTPIPHLPMTFHINCWPSRSIELAGRVKHRLLPASATVTSVDILANCVNSSQLSADSHPGLSAGSIIEES